MKNIVFSILLTLTASFTAIAQEKVILKAGTIIPLQANKTVAAADVTEGELVNFSVSNDVKVNGKTVISKGTLVSGKVVEAKKSSLAGTKGRLVINFNKMLLQNGEPLYFSDSTIRIYGKNRTPLAVVLGCLVWPCFFIPGSKAEMPVGYEAEATVAANTEIILN